MIPKGLFMLPVPSLRRCSSIALGLAFFVTASMRSAHAVDFNWNVSGSGLFNTAGNWDVVGGPPNDAADTATFDQTTATPYTVTFQTGQTNNFYRVRNGNVTFGLSGQTYTLTGTSFVGDVDGQTGRLTLSNGTVTGGNLDIGDSAADIGLLTVTTNATLSTGTFNVADNGTGTLTIQNGGVVASGATSIGNAATSLGTATVTGAGSNWNASGSINVGNSGTGTLNINTGGSVNTSSNLTLGSNALGDGTATVSGTGSSLSNGGTLFVGNSGQGSLVVSGGATAQSSGGTNVGLNVGSNGDVTITGAGSSFFGNAITVGSSGNGLFEVLAGGSVSNSSTSIGSVGTGTVSIDGSGSIWNASGATTIGNGVGSDGALFVTDGGAYHHSSSTAITVGGAGVGQMLVSGANSLVSAPTAALDIGTTGSGLLSILDGGTVTTNSVQLGLSAGGIGTATVAGVGSVWNSGALSIGSANSGNATLTVDDGGTVNATTIVLVDPAAATATLAITGGTVNTTGFARGTGNLNFNGGLFHVSTGPFNNGSVASQLTLSGATLDNEPTLRLSNNASTQNVTQLVIGNSINHRGALEVVSGADFTLTGAGTSSLATSLSSSSASVLVSGSGSTLSATGQEFRIGDTGVASFEVRDSGSATLRDVTLGVSAGSSGSAQVADVGSNIAVTNALNVGANGSGRLDVTAGGTVAAGSLTLGGNATGVGTLVIDGPGSRVTTTADGIVVSNAGQGFVTVQNGGRLETVAAASFFNGDIGTGTGSGTVTVTGDGSLWRASSVSIGATNSGTSTLSVTNGGAVEFTGNLTLNDPTGAPDGILNIDGGTVTIDGTFTRRGVLQFNDGTLNIAGSYNSVVPAPLVINGSTATANPTLRFVSLSTTASVTDLTIGQDRTATLYVEPGSSVTPANLFIGADPGANGHVTNEGSISTTAALAVGGDASIGGHGTLTLSNGSTTTVGTSLALFPQGTIHLNGGELALGALNPQGGTLNFNSGVVRYTGTILLNDAQLTGILGPAHTVQLGRTIRSNNDMTLSADLTVNGGRLQSDGVLNLNAGRLRVSSGVAEAMFLTNVAAGATLSIEGGSFNVTSSSLQVLAGGEVELHGGTSTITTLNGLVNSGLVRGDGRINARLTNNSVGEVRIGVGERLHFASTVAGQTNGGLMNVTGGTLELTGALTNSASTGLIAAKDATVHFKGGLTNNGSLTVTTGISDVFGDINNAVGGRIVVSGGAFANFYDDVSNSGTINVSAAGTLKSTAVFFGDLAGGGVAGAGQVFIEGDMRPGFSPGTMAFGGDLSFGPLAALEIELAGTTPGTQFDRVTVANQLSLGGALEVSLLGGFTPTTGDSFEIVTAGGGITGTFDSEALPLLGGGLSFDVEYDPNSVMLNAIGVLGDYNFDGTVNAADYLVWRKTLGQAGAGLAADGNLNGSIDAGDYDVWTTNFGRVASAAGGSPASSAGVPEPASCVMLAIAALALGPARLWSSFRARRSPAKS